MFRLVLTLVLLAGRVLAQEEVEFPDDYEATVDTQDQDIGDLSYESAARRPQLLLMSSLQPSFRIMMRRTMKKPHTTTSWRCRHWTWRRTLRTLWRSVMVARYLTDWWIVCRILTLWRWMRSSHWNFLMVPQPPPQPPRPPLPPRQPPPPLLPPATSLWRWVGIINCQGLLWPIFIVSAVLGGYGARGANPSIEVLPSSYSSITSRRRMPSLPRSECSTLIGRSCPDTVL